MVLKEIKVWMVRMERMVFLEVVAAVVAVSIAHSVMMAQVMAVVAAEVLVVRA